MKEKKKRQMTLISTSNTKDGVLDEIIVGDWFHLELMDEKIGHYWLRLGDRTYTVLIPHTGEDVKVNPQDEDEEAYKEARQNARNYKG